MEPVSHCSQPHCSGHPTDTAQEANVIPVAKDACPPVSSVRPSMNVGNRPAGKRSRWDGVWRAAGGSLWEGCVLPEAGVPFQPSVSISTCPHHWLVTV